MAIFNKRDKFFKRENKVLHIAPEQAFYKRFKEIRFWDYLTLDLRSPIADIKADITNLPFDENVFDLIICNHVLEHIQDDKIAMKEIYRVLKKNGVAIMQIPIDTKRAENI